MIVFILFFLGFNNLSRNKIRSSSSSSPIQGLGHWPLPASMNSTFCVVYQDLFFPWACTKEPVSAKIRS
jgi:hypothetical protein